MNTEKGSTSTVHPRGRMSTSLPTQRPSPDSSVLVLNSNKVLIIAGSLGKCVTSISFTKFGTISNSGSKPKMQLSEDKQRVLDTIQSSASLQGIYFQSSSAVDLSKGCDQLVFCVARDDCTQMVIKYPTEEKDKVEKQYIMSALSVLGGYNASQPIHHTSDYLIESFVLGEPLSLSAHGKHVWRELGHQMKCLHSTSGAHGFSNRAAGESCTKFPIFDTYHEKMCDSLRWEDPSLVPGVEQYLGDMLKEHKQLLIKPCCLHYDITFDNVLVSDSCVTLIDFADAGMGDWREDFAFMYCNLHNTPQWEYLLEGYGNVTNEDMRWMGFFCVVWLTWALVGEDQPHKRQHQLNVARQIVASEHS